MSTLQKTGYRMSTLQKTKTSLIVIFIVEKLNISIKVNVCVKITDDFDDSINSTNSENDNIDIILSPLLLSIHFGILFLCFMIWTMIKPLLTDK